MIRLPLAPITLSVAIAAIVMIFTYLAIEERNERQMNNNSTSTEKIQQELPMMPKADVRIAQIITTGKSGPPLTVLGTDGRLYEYARRGWIRLPDLATATDIEVKPGKSEKERSQFCIESPCVPDDESE